MATYLIVTDSPIFTALARGEEFVVTKLVGRDRISGTVTRLRPRDRLAVGGVKFVLTTLYDERYMPHLAREMERQNGLAAKTIRLLQVIGVDTIGHVTQ